MLFELTTIVDISALAVTLWMAFYLFGRGFPSRITLRAVIVLLLLSVFFFSVYSSLFHHIVGTVTLRAVIVVVGAALPDARATMSQGETNPCNHFSVDYDSLACFLSEGTPAGGGSAVGSTDGDTCPGGTRPSCVECAADRCVWACSGGYTCKFFRQADGEPDACATTHSCRTL